MSLTASEQKQAPSFTLVPAQEAVRAALERFKADRFGERLWAKDAALWKSDEAHRKIILNSLGWLTVADQMAANLKELNDFSEQIRSEGFTDAVLLGMGGSSLAAEVFRHWLPARPGSPRLHMLDSTDPGWVESIERAVKMEKTLFIVSSKSGSTVEPNCFYSYFWERAGKKGSQFVAVTDPGSSLEALARERGFRKVFLNPSDIGGRFSALSYFGLVPAAAGGLDIGSLLESARSMMRACGPQVSPENNPGLQLGAAIGALAKAGRDKVTVLVPNRLESFGLWIEQLIAESSGKEGRGIVPIAAETPAGPSAYGSDRFFVSITVETEKSPEQDRLVQALKNSHPVAEIRLKKTEELGGEMLRWEIATAAACAVIGVDAFDQPNVQEAKDLTKALLKELGEKGSLPQPQVHLQGKGFTVSFSRECARSVALGDSVTAFKDFLRRIRTGEYLGLLAYLPFSERTDERLVRLRALLRDSLRAATLFGYGPRYLHSTGQLHKGGADSGVFILLTDEPEKDLPVPGQPYSFGQLEMAQALGDFQALDQKGRRAVRVHLKAPLDRSLEEFERFAEDALKGTGRI